MDADRYSDTGKGEKMSDKKTQGGKKGRKIGRAAKHPCHVAYTRNNRRFKNKLKRVLQSNGKAAADEYARKYKNAKVDTQ